MNTILPFDEINALEYTLPAYFQDGKLKEDVLEDLLDAMEDLFLLSYTMGMENVNSQFGSDYKPPVNEVMKTVDREIAGKTWRERVRDYARDGGTPADISRIIETEAHRDSNEAAFRAAEAAGATEKEWHCMMLPTSRDTHIYLNGVTAPLDGEFYSFKGGSTKFPGQWGIAEEDVNCLCWLTFK